MNKMKSMAALYLTKIGKLVEFFVECCIIIHVGYDKGENRYGIDGNFKWYSSKN